MFDFEAALKETTAPSGPSTGGSFDFEAALKETASVSKPTGQMVVGQQTPIVEQPTAAKAAQPKTVSFEELYKNDDNFAVVQDYMKVATGDVYDPKKQSREEFVKDFMSASRFRDLNVSLGVIPELVKLKNSDAATRAKIGRGRELYEQTASVFEEGGQKGVRPYFDAIKALASDPTTYLGGIAGQIVKQPMKRAATQAGADAMRRSAMMKAGAIGFGVEATIGAASNVFEQRRNIEAAASIGKERQFDAAELAMVTALSGVFGGVSGASTAAVKVTPNVVALEKKIDETTKQMAKKGVLTPSGNLTQPAKKLTIDAINDNMENVADQWRKQEGKKYLEEVDPATSITDSKVRNDIIDRTVDVVWGIIKNDSNFQIRDNEQVSSAFARVIEKLDTDEIDDLVLQRAIADAGLTPDEFAKTTMTTASEAGKTLNSYSQAAKLIRRMGTIDPEFKKRFDELYSKDDNRISAGAALHNALSRVGNERKAILTSGIDTLVRNVVGANVGLTMKAGSRLLEGLIYNMGTTAAAMMGKQIDEPINRGFGDVVSDAFLDFYYLKNNGLATSVTDTLLNHHPQLKTTLIDGFENTNVRDVSRVAKLASTFSQSVDAFQRKAVFTASVERQLKDLGIDLYGDVMKNNKVVPVDVIRQALDDAMKSTFSYMPKKGDQLQDGFGTLGNVFVKTAETIDPLGAVITFPRFMANTAGFVYRYGGGGTFTTGKKLVEARKAAKEGKDALSQRLYREAAQSTAETAVGMSMLLAAIDYRRNNQDKNWYEMETPNGTIDTRQFFPLNLFLGAGDVMAKSGIEGAKPDFKGVVESFIGLKMPAGSTNTFVENLYNIFQGEDRVEKNIAEELGKGIGNYFGGFTQPFVVKQVFDLVDMMRGDAGSIARDPNVAPFDPTASPLNVFASQVERSFIKSIPIAKESLAPAAPKLGEDFTYNEGAFFNRLTAARTTPTRGNLEKALIEIGVQPFELYGKPSGIKAYDNALTREVNPRMVSMLSSEIESERWQNSSMAERRNLVRKIATDVRSEVDAQLKDSMMQTPEGARMVGKIEYDRLSKDDRAVVERAYAKNNNGKKMEETGEFEQLPGYRAAIEASKSYAKGGLIRAAAKLFAGEAAEDVAKVGKKVVTDIPTDSSVIKQTDKLLTPQSSVVPATKPTPQQIEKAAPVAAKSPYDFPNKAFTDADYAAAEKTMEQELGQMAKNMKVTQPKEYANMLHSYVAMEKKIKYKDMPPSPYKTDEIVDEVPVQEAAAPVGKQLPFEEEPVPVFLSEKAKKGWLGDVRGFQNRDDILAQIKEVRREDFPSLRKSKLLKGIDDLAIGSTQGDFRFINGREVNVKSAKDMAEFADMAKAAQRRLDALRKEHKNKPPKVLFHGSKSISGAEGLRSKGFADPRSLNKTEPGQVELDVNIPSFTSDLNLPFKSGSFGGRDKERFVAYEVPYAEYVFNRVNMAESDYNNKNLNVIARAISGAPNQIRPLGLPRTGYFETEDSIVDAEKLTRSSGRLSLPDDMIESKAARFEQINARRQELAANLNTSASNFDDSLKSANEVYKNLRDYTKHLYRNVEMTSVKSGTGQQFEVQFTNMPVNSSSLRKVANVLRKNGSEERAALVEKIASLKIKMLNDASAKEAQQIRKEIADTIPKLNKGGFVTRR